MARAYIVSWLALYTTGPLANSRHGEGLCLERNVSRPLSSRVSYRLLNSQQRPSVVGGTRNRVFLWNPNILCPARFLCAPKRPIDCLRLYRRWPCTFIWFDWRSLLSPMTQVRAPCATGFGTFWTLLHALIVTGWICVCGFMVYVRTSWTCAALGVYSKYSALSF